MVEMVVVAGIRYRPEDAPKTVGKREAGEPVKRQPVARGTNRKK